MCLVVVSSICRCRTVSCGVGMGVSLGWVFDM
jgi:hypothetical protein